MAIKVNGTTVIDDSRNLSNVGGLKTVNGTSLVGSGNISAGASTTAGAVGTYTVGRPDNATNYNQGDTVSSLRTIGPNDYGNQPYWDYTWYNADQGSVQSGTWRAMSEAYGNGSNRGLIGLWVRIS
jgi:hypothetical protein